VIVLEHGAVVESGTRDSVFFAPRAEQTKRLIAAIPGASRRPPRAHPAPSASPPALEVIGVTKSYARRGGLERRRIALADVSFTVAAGETLGVVGESGSGKSTLAWILAGLSDGDAGQVRVLGDPWAPLSHRQRLPRRHLVQMVYQDPLSSFDPRHTVAGVVADALAVRGVPAAQRRDEVTHLVGQVGLSPSLASRRPLTLSGGQRQRLAIARALAMRPRILVLDEPVSALDPAIQAQILDLLRMLQRELGMTYVFISHDLGIVRDLSDTLLVLERGRVVEHGDCEQLFGAPRHAYTRALIDANPQLPRPSKHSLHP
jgi:peptide/nickel transport system ATP-binding protein